MGIERQNTPDHLFQYNGKEKQTELGLNWYDYHARQYDPQIGRFTTVDPDADNYYDLTPYNYVDNSPINNIDPDGKNIWTKVAKAAVKVGKTVAKDGVSSLKNGATYADAVSDIVADVSTLTNSNASLTDRVIAGASLASELLPVSVGDVKDAYKLAKVVAGKADDVKDASKTAKGVIYRVPGEKTPSGQPYIGSSDDLPKRTKTAKDGRDRTGAEIVGEYPIGDKSARRKAEQQAINDNGGVKNLDNKRNEIKEKDWEKNGVK